MKVIARGTFEITMSPPAAELDGAAARIDFDKTFHGDLDAASRGILLSAGDPATGHAGYVALEAVSGRLHERTGGFAFQQLGQLTGGEPTLRYAIVPGSGTGELAGVVGTLDLRVEDGVHHYSLAYSFA